VFDIYAYFRIMAERTDDFSVAMGQIEKRAVWNVWLAVGSRSDINITRITLDSSCHYYSEHLS